MAFSHGVKAVFKLHDGTTLQDISTFVKAVKMPRKATTAEVTALQATSKAYIPGLFEGTVTIEGMWDPAVDGYLQLALGNQRAFEYYPSGTSAGNVKYNGNLIGTSYDPSTPVSEAGVWSFEGIITGAVTRTAL